MNQSPLPHFTRRSLLLTSAAASGALFLAESGSGQTGTSGEQVHVCPKSRPPARKLAVMRLEDLTSDAWDMKLTLTCLQGIVNRKEPRLYMIQDRYDDLWLNWLRERGDIAEIERLEVGQVFERFLSEVKVAFITDPAIPGTVNVATMLAGLHDGLVITPQTAAQYDLPMGTITDGWNAGKDLQEMGWKKDVDAYRWAFEQIGDRLSHKAVSFLDPATVALRDYLVEFQIPILWISSPQDAHKNPQASFDEEKAFAREILMKWPANIPCMGWPGNGVGSEEGIGEWEGVKLGSECGKFEVCSGYDGYSPTVSNLSVHSGTTAKLHQTIPPAPGLQRDKVYLAFARSDGDGLNFLRHYYRKLFDDPQHGDVPLGWQVGPTATDTMPDILDYYYKHARKGDCFMNALSGVGYIHEAVYAANYPPEQRDQILKDFQRISGDYRARLDAAVMATFAEMPTERMAVIAGVPGIKGVFANYGRTHATTPENVISASDGRPIFRAVNRGPGELTFTPTGRENAAAFMIGEIRRWTPAKRPAFMHVFLANWLSHMEMLDAIFKGVGPEYVAVRPDQLVELYKSAS